MHPIDSGIRTNVVHEDRIRTAASRLTTHHEASEVANQGRSWLRSAARLLRIEWPAPSSPLRRLLE